MFNDTYNNSIDECGECTSNKALPCLLGREFNEWSLPKEEAKHVGHDVIADNHGDWNKEPEADIWHLL